MDLGKTLQLSGRSVNYIDQGKGETLLLIHGFPLDHSMWQRQIDFFQASYRVVCPDLPGFGASDPLDGLGISCLLYTSPSPRDKRQSRMPSSA